MGWCGWPSLPWLTGCGYVKKAGVHPSRRHPSINLMSLLAPDIASSAALLQDEQALAEIAPALL
ncbi:hypothetical protein SPRA44_90132 [Serratia proteamaculans]|nr:hypothetical protein SPRA44_90132 [Serratia proteamaculans]